MTKQSLQAVPSPGEHRLLKQTQSRSLSYLLSKPPTKWHRPLSTDGMNNTKKEDIHGKIFGGLVSRRTTSGTSFQTRDGDGHFAPPTSRNGSLLGSGNFMVRIKRQIKSIVDLHYISGKHTNHNSKELLKSNSLRVFVGTWNMCGTLPVSVTPFLPAISETCMNPPNKKSPDQVLGDPSYHPYHIMVIATQECERSISESVVFPSKAAWEQMIMSTYGKYYTQVACATMAALHLCVLVWKPCAHLVSQVEMSTVPTGIAGVVGNKGGVGIGFNFGQTSLLFVNVHLTAHQENVHLRNADYFKIENSLDMPLHISPMANIATPSLAQSMMSARMSSNVDLGPTLASDAFDYSIFVGDTNYRIDKLDAESVVEKIQNKFLHECLANDQLSVQRKAGNTFIGFNEAPITFPPTFKLMLGSKKPVSSEPVNHMIIRRPTLLLRRRTLRNKNSTLPIPILSECASDSDSYYNSAGEENQSSNIVEQDGVRVQTNEPTTLLKNVNADRDLGPSPNRGGENSVDIKSNRIDPPTNKNTEASSKMPLEYNTRRIPSWTDRILYKAKADQANSCTKNHRQEKHNEHNNSSSIQRSVVRVPLYTSVIEQGGSDHVPVIGVFEMPFDWSVGMHFSGSDSTLVKGTLKHRWSRRNSSVMNSKLKLARRVKQHQKVVPLVVHDRLAIDDGGGSPDEMRSVQDSVSQGDVRSSGLLLAPGTGLHPVSAPDLAAVCSKKHTNAHSAANSSSLLESDANLVIPDTTKTPPPLLSKKVNNDRKCKLKKYIHHLRPASDPNIRVNIPNPKQGGSSSRRAQRTCLLM